MKTILKMALVCFLSLSFLTLSSCSSKVNQKELDNKIENEGLENASFTDAEYDFMAKYLLDRISEGKEWSATDPESKAADNYMLILWAAAAEDKLKGDAKKDFETVQKKIQSIMNSDTMETPSSYDNSEWDSLAEVSDTAWEVY
ncbi:MAG: hypothetical protein HDS70_05685 [Bacteroidales bacterium]|nr:hypothetical protein [Bacteroidales bacterium]MBD5221844.1 hypothetical protein [Bacteroidales bacterium]